MKHIIRYFSLFFIALSLFVTSCTTSKPHITPVSRQLTGKGIKTPVQLQEFFFSHNPNLPVSQISLMAKLYVEEAAMENINSDAAFVQMCLETGFLTFGNLVVPEMHNYCGLGAMDAEHPGEWFPDERTGVRAHIQHLQAYATKEDVKLNNPLVDPRYSWPHKTRYAESVFQLAGTWAMDVEYGNKLNNLLSELERY